MSKSNKLFFVILGVIFILTLVFLFFEQEKIKDISINPVIVNLMRQFPETEENSNSQPATTTTIKTFGISDPAGQLVHHLFDIKGIPSPKALAFSPDDKEIWATMLLNQKRGLAVFNSQAGEKISDINLNDGGGVELIFSKDGTKVYISQMETAKVFEVDANTKKILRVFDTKSTWTKILELSPDGKTLYAANWVGDDVSEINLETGKLVRRIPAVDTPRGLYATKDGNYLYVAGFGNGELEKIDLKTGKGKIIYTTGGALRHFAADQERGILFVSDMGKNEIFKINLATDEVVKFADTDMNPNTIILSPDKNVLFVSCRGENYSATNYSIPGPEWGSVLLFDAKDGKMLDAIIGGNQPTALAISFDGKTLVFSDFLDSKLEVFEIPSYETLKVGNGGRSSVYKQGLRKY